MVFGFLCMVLGITYIIIYINLFTFGYTIKDYLLFILSSYECYLLPIGLLIEIIMLHKRKDKRK